MDSSSWGDLINLGAGQCSRLVLTAVLPRSQYTPSAARSDFGHNWHGFT